MPYTCHDPTLVVREEKRTKHARVLSLREAPNSKKKKNGGNFVVQVNKKVTN